MARYTGPKNKLSRREGVNLFGKKIRPERLSIPPGVHGKKYTRLSNYGQQLREKQKASRLYGVLERQFRRYVEEARKSKENTTEVLISLLERRLDNVIFRLGFAPTRPAARQLVTHGHVRVDNQKVTIPSFEVSPEQIITISAKALEIPHVKESLSNKTVKPPKWLERKAGVGKVVRVPSSEDFTEGINVDEIIAFYSK